MLPKDLGSKFWNRLGMVADNQEEEKLRRRMIDILMDQRYGTGMKPDRIGAKMAGLYPPEGRLPSDHGDPGFPSDLPTPGFAGPGAYHSGMNPMPDMEVGARLVKKSPRRFGYR